MSMNITQLVGFNGKADALIAAFLLKQQGLNVKGLCLFSDKKEHFHPDFHRFFSLEKKQVLSNAKSIGVDVKFLNIDDELEMVEEQFVSCKIDFRYFNCLVEINRIILKKLLAQGEECELITGHRIRYEDNENGSSLRSFQDIELDQSHLIDISFLDQGKFSFPLGTLSIEKFNKIAQQLNAKRVDSTNSMKFSSPEDSVAQSLIKELRLTRDGLRNIDFDHTPGLIHVLVKDEIKAASCQALRLRSGKEEYNDLSMPKTVYLKNPRMIPVRIYPQSFGRFRLTSVHNLTYNEGQFISLYEVEGNGNRVIVQGFVEKHLDPSIEDQVKETK